jgi:hypothetical protein
MGIGLGALTLLGRTVSALVDYGAQEPPSRPRLLPQQIWGDHTSSDGSGSFFGFLERTLFFIAFWTDGVTLAAAWLAFKLASKWEAWKNIIRVPEKIEDGNASEWFEATHTFGSWILQRFWVGTLLNILFALAAVGFGHLVSRALR